MRGGGVAPPWFPATVARVCVCVSVQRKGQTESFLLTHEGRGVGGVLSFFFLRHARVSLLHGAPLSLSPTLSLPRKETHASTLHAANGGGRGRRAGVPKPIKEESQGLSSQQKTTEARRRPRPSRPSSASLADDVGDVGDVGDDVVAKGGGQVGDEALDGALAGQLWEREREEGGRQVRDKAARKRMERKKKERARAPPLFSLARQHKIQNSRWPGRQSR